MKPYRPMPKVGPKEWPLYVKRAVAGAVLGVVVALGFVAADGCAGSLPSPTPIVNTLPPLGVCVVQAAAADLVEAISDPVSLVGAIISACSSYGAATVDQIIAWVEQAIAAPPVFTDAGAVSIAVQKARLTKVRAAALAMQHVVVVAPKP